MPNSKSRSNGRVGNGKASVHYESMSQLEVPQNRNGKHREVVNLILGDLTQLEAGRAIKVPLDGLKDSKENIRAALSRETRKRGLTIKTSADAEFLYVWSAE